MVFAGALLNQTPQSSRQAGLLFKVIFSSPVPRQRCGVFEYAKNAKSLNQIKRINIQIARALIITRVCAVACACGSEAACVHVQHYRPEINWMCYLSAKEE
jgi:hypothetical protein